VGPGDRTEVAAILGRCALPARISATTLSSSVASAVSDRVSTRGNCWTATLVNAAGMLGLPRHSADCIHLLDQLTD
jgi:hypothetical protein